MIYQAPSLDEPLGQGDIIDNCPLVFWSTERDKSGKISWSSTTSDERIVVLSQACDLANARATKVQVAVLHETAWLVNEGVLKSENDQRSSAASPCFRLVFPAQGANHFPNLWQTCGTCTQFHVIFSMPKSRTVIAKPPSPVLIANTWLSNLRSLTCGSPCPSLTKLSLQVGSTRSWKPAQSTRIVYAKLDRHDSARWIDCFWRCAPFCLWLVAN